MKRYRFGNKSKSIKPVLLELQELTYIMAPETIPEQPIPEIARPMMKQLDVGATPDKRDPSSKIPMATRKVTLTGQNVYSFPQKSWNEQLVR